MIQSNWWTLTINPYCHSWDKALFLTIFNFHFTQKCETMLAANRVPLLVICEQVHRKNTRYTKRDTIKSNTLIVWQTCVRMLILALASVVLLLRDKFDQLKTSDIHQARHNLCFKKYFSTDTKYLYVKWRLGEMLITYQLFSTFHVFIMFVFLSLREIIVLSCFYFLFCLLFSFLYFCPDNHFVMRGSYFICTEEKCVWMCEQNYSNMYGVYCA